MDLQIGFGHANREAAPQSAVIWQRIWQQIPGHPRWWGPCSHCRTKNDRAVTSFGSWDTSRDTRTGYYLLWQGNAFARASSTRTRESRCSLGACCSAAMVAVRKTKAKSSARPDVTVIRRLSDTFRDTAKCWHNRSRHDSKAGKQASPKSRLGGGLLDLSRSDGFNLPNNVQVE